MAGIPTSDGGSITYHNYKGNVSYSIYVPANVSADTPIFTYTYGSGRTDDWWSRYHSAGNYGIYDALIANGSDSIVIMPTMDWGADWGKNTMEIINSVRAEYGITNLNVSGSGFSKGGFGGFDIVAENIRQNPDLDPQVVFFVDDYSSTYYMARNKLGNGKAELFAENNTVFFAYDPYWKGTDKYQAYIDAGINVIRVEPANYDHVQINANFFKNGIYDYMAGEQLPADGYVYKVYNKNTGSWEEIEYSQIATVDKLYDFYGIDNLQTKINTILGLASYDIKSDNEVVAEYLNKILSCIKSSNFLTASLDSFAGSSDTNVPSQVPYCVRKHFISVAKMFTKLTSLMDTVASIDPSYQETDQNLVNMVNGINDSSNIEK